MKKTAQTTVLTTPAIERASFALPRAARARLLVRTAA